MSTASLLEALSSARDLLGKIYDQVETDAELGGEYSRLMSRISFELSNPPGLTVGPASSKDALEKGHVFEIELPSGHHVSVPATIDALVLLNDWIRNRENELEKMRKDKSRANIIRGLGTKVSPIQHEVDKAIREGRVRKFTEDGVDVRDVKKSFSSLSDSEVDDFMSSLEVSLDDLLEESSK